ncbi:hypothetical protein [Streptomyces camelliae]|uniref:Uncharacterized protein n=1 Tax=Streptomyces camelliae TaxID=3004093 RepID=A0ABY7P5H8_9ACTN|nr:hypothetical protein [Streptomyces sp. HUAS 2-6]WBO64962.1 hypothetical protein O1G22_20060 [Streptomyces sp. HUAS 2-6]
MRIRTTLATTAAALAIAVAPAFAANPHFINASATGPNPEGQLTVSFKEAGLGNNQNINYQADAQASATYQCFNKGGHNPAAGNKTTVLQDVSAFGTFNSGRNGSVTASLTIDPPGPGTFTCPPGQKLIGPTDVSYTDVSITDLTNGVTEPIPGTFS